MDSKIPIGLCGTYSLTQRSGDTCIGLGIMLAAVFWTRSHSLDRNLIDRLMREAFTFIAARIEQSVQLAGLFLFAALMIVKEEGTEAITADAIAAVKKVALIWFMVLCLDCLRPSWDL